MCSNISELDKWFFLRNENSIYAIEIIFAQWVIYCTRKQKFFLRNDKDSNLNHIILRNESRSYAYDVLHHIIHCIHIFAFPIMKGFDMII